MQINWYSIEPTFIESGAIETLLPLGRRTATLKLVPIPDIKNPYDGANFDIESKFVSSHWEAKMSYVSFFSGSLNAQNRLFMYEFLYYKEAHADPPHGGLIAGTRYGTALRIGVNLKKIEIDISANFMAISAAVALGKAEASYKIQGISLGNALGQIAPDLPTSGNFDFEAFSKIAGLGTKLIAWIDKNKSQLGVNPIQIGIITPFDVLVSESSQSMYYAMLKIKKGHTLSRALKEKPQHLKEDTIRETYKRITNREDPDYVLQSNDKELAKNWLNFKS